MDLSSCVPGLDFLVLNCLFSFSGSCINVLQSLSYSLSLWLSVRLSFSWHSLSHTHTLPVSLSVFFSLWWRAGWWERTGWFASTVCFSQHNEKEESQAKLFVFAGQTFQWLLHTHTHTHNPKESRKIGTDHITISLTVVPYPFTCPHKSYSATCAQLSY